MVIPMEREMNKLKMCASAFDEIHRVLEEVGDKYLKRIREVELKVDNSTKQSVRNIEQARLDALNEGLRLHTFGTMNMIGKIMKNSLEPEVVD